MIYCATTKASVPPEIKSAVAMLNTQLSKNAISFDRYEKVAKGLKEKVKITSWPTLSNMLFISL